MRFKLFVISVVLMVLGGVMVWADLTAGAKAPNFTLKTLDGQTFKLSDCFEKPGNVVVLDLWATWCPPCEAVTPNLVKIAKTYAGQPVKVVGVALDEAQSDVEEYVKQKGINYTICLDSEGAVLDKPYKLRDGIPALYVIDKSGVIRMVEVGFPQDKEMQAKAVKRLTNTIDRLLKRK